MISELNLSETEQEQLAIKLSDPLVCRYFQFMYDKLADLSATSTVQPGQTAEEFLRFRAHAQGAMEAFHTLMKIKSQS